MISLIRYAKEKDTRHIWEAHQASIKTFCSKDYTNEEIKGWTSFPYSHEHWTKTMNKDVVLVLELNGQVEGFGHLRLDPSVAEVEGLYFSPAAKGRGLGKTFLQTLEKIAWEKGYRKMILKSTRTSLGFYQKCGFSRVGDSHFVQTRGVSIELFLMQKKLVLENSLEEK